MEQKAKLSSSKFERKTFPSRKTTFPIFSGDVGDSWLQLLNLVLKVGTEKQTTDGGRFAEAVNAIVTIDPNVTWDIEPNATENDFPIFFDFSHDDLHRYFRRFEASSSLEKKKEDELHHNRYVIDQIESICIRLQETSGTHAGTVVFHQPDGMIKSKQVPGLLSATFDVADGMLFGSFVQRSVDIYNDWPLEAMALVRLQQQIAGRAGLALGTTVFIIHSAQINDSEWDRASGLLTEHLKRPLPLQIDPAGIFLFGKDKGQARAMLLTHDASAILWEGAFSNPEDLSWYIIDVMPWLHPQHIRYVGQECAALMQAIKTDACYVQG